MNNKCVTKDVRGKIEERLTWKKKRMSVDMWDLVLKEIVRMTTLVNCLLVGLPPASRSGHNKFDSGVTG